MVENTFLNMHLLDAVQRGSLQIAANLIKAGANPAAYDHTAEPLVHVAYEHSGPAMADMIKLLVDKGADAYATAENMNTIFDKMAINCEFYNMKTICSLGISPMSGCNRDLMQDAVVMGFGNIKLAIESGVKPQGLCIEYACRDFDYRSIKLLAKAGADVNKRNYDGNTPLMVIADDKFKKKFFNDVKKGVNWITKDKSKLKKILLFRRIQVIITLLKLGADMNMKNYDDKTVFALTSDKDIIKVLNRYTKGQLVLAV